MQRAPPANIVSRPNIWYEIVPFVRNKCWRVKCRRKRAPQQCLNGNSQSGSTTASKDAICTSEKHVNKEKTVNEPTFARLVGGATQWPIANSLPVLNSPFNPSTWRTSLHDFSDLSFTDDLIYDIEHGGRIEYIGPRTSRISPNHLSAIWNITSTALELERELGLGRKIGPFLTPSVKNFVRSPMGAIPKKPLKPIKWCIIHDLSWPTGHSINDSIPKDLFSCTYDTLDTAIAPLKSFSQGALMSKLDLSDAFRHVILVHPADWKLLSSSWPIEIDCSMNTAYFIDTYLPFGLPSLPSLFLKFAYSFANVMYSCGVFPVWDYLDDFLTCGPPKPDPVCLSNL